MKITYFKKFFIRQDKKFARPLYGGKKIRTCRGSGPEKIRYTEVNFHSENSGENLLSVIGRYPLYGGTTVISFL